MGRTDGPETGGVLSTSLGAQPVDPGSFSSLCPAAVLLGHRNSVCSQKHKLLISKSELQPPRCRRRGTVTQGPTVVRGKHILASPPLALRTQEDTAPAQVSYNDSARRLGPWWGSH